jgi:hypothetical protein
MSKISSRFRQEKQQATPISRLRQCSNWLSDNKAIGIAITTVMAGLAWILINAPIALKNINDLPEQVRPIAKNFLSWYHEDKQWEGTWSSYPEGIIDAEDMKLSDTDITLDIQAENGRIGGMITSRRVCETFPYLQSLMLEGDVSGKSARVAVFDYIGGKRVNIVRLKLLRHESVITIAAIDDEFRLFPKEVRVGHHPNLQKTSQQELLAAHCTEFRTQFSRPAYEKFMEGKEPRKSGKQMSPHLKQ